MKNFFMVQIIQHVKKMSTLYFKKNKKNFKKISQKTFSKINNKLN